MKIQNANNLKPSKNEISHIQTLTSDKKIQQWSVYFLDGKYYLTKGMLFNERQNHKIEMTNKNYSVIAKFLTESK